MSAVNEILEQLVAIKCEFEELDEDIVKREFFEVEAVLNKITAWQVKLPNDLKFLISVAEKLNLIEGLFSGYKILNVERFLEIYKSNTTHLNFLSLLSCEEKLGLAIHEIDFYEGDFTSDNDIRESTRVLGRFVPIAKEKTDFLVVDLASTNENRMYDLQLGHSAFLYAPSVSKHIDNIIYGLQSNRFQVVDGDLSFPKVWHERE